MVVHEERVFIRHFFWALLALVAGTIFFVFLAFFLVGVTGGPSHSGYAYVQYLQKHPGKPVTGGAVSTISRAGSASVPATVPGAAPRRQVATNTPTNGKAVWEAHCSVCHLTGVAGAPKIGDKARWTAILASTSPALLHEHAIRGFQGKHGFMPAKGGAPGLTNAQVDAAVDYMVDKSR